MYKRLIPGFLLCLTMFAPGIIQAQYQENALKFSEINVNGTARFQGLGGGHAALGGDASAITSNPAGLGFYTRSELSVTPGYYSGKSDSRFLSTSTTESTNQFFVGNASLVIANQNRDSYRRSKWRGTAMGVSFNRQQTFNRSYSFAGNSTGKRFIDNIVASANTFSDDELDMGLYEDPRTGEIYLDYLEGVYFHLYAFDPENDQPNAPFVPVESGPVVPSGYVDNTGSHSQWTFSYAGNYDDKLYIGGSLGFNRITSSTNRMLDERYVSGEVFTSTRYEEWTDMTGNGFNLTLGAIYKVTPDVQLGVNMSTPTFMRLQRSLYERASVEVKVPDDLPTVGRTHPWDFDYTQVGPFRASLGGTWFLPNQLGFITGSLDFVGYKGMSIRHNRERDGVWNDLTGWYRNVVNPKVGAEFRFQTLRVRAGMAYFMDPYEGKLIDIVEDRMSFSSGLGYRGNRFFADLSMVLGSQRGAYQLFENSDTGTLTTKDVSGVLTVGFNF